MKIKMLRYLNVHPYAAIPTALGLAFAPLVYSRTSAIKDKKFNNTNPRENMEEYAKSLSPEQSKRVQRAENAHKNGIEALVFYAPAALAAVQAGVPKCVVGIASGVFLLSRALYNVAYIFGDTEKLSYLRTLVFTVTPVTSVTLCILALKAAKKK